MVETSALVAIILEEPGWRQLAERVVAASAFTTCFNVFEAALAVVREKDLTPSEAHLIVLDTVARLGVEIGDYPSQAILTPCRGAGERQVRVGGLRHPGAIDASRASRWSSPLSRRERGTPSGSRGGLRLCEDRLVRLEPGGFLAGPRHDEAGFHDGAGSASSTLRTRFRSGCPVRRDQAADRDFKRAWRVSSVRPARTMALMSVPFSRTAPAR